MFCWHSVITDLHITSSQPGRLRIQRWVSPHVVQIREAARSSHSNRPLDFFFFFFPSLIPDEGAETTHFTDCTQTSGSEISQQIGTNSDVFFLYCHAARRRLVCRFYFGSGGSLKQIISHRWVWFSSSLLPSERVVSVTSDCARVSNVS